MITLSDGQKRAFNHWRRCGRSGDFVKMHVAPYEDGSKKQIRQKGFCSLKNEDVDMGLCVLCEDHAPRRPPKHKRTPTRRARTSKAMQRSAARKKDHHELLTGGRRI